jgi:predicted transcriptional regulator
MYRDSTSHLGLRVDVALKEAIEKLAAAEGRTVSNWVARALVQEVARQTKEAA